MAVEGIFLHIGSQPFPGGHTLSPWTKAEYGDKPISGREPPSSAQGGIHNVF
jgi:hypothetical protein